MRPFLIALFLGACVTTQSGRGGEASAPGEFAWFDQVSIPDHAAPCTAEDKIVLVRGLERLTSSDFATYSSAARSLVGLGERAAPYLGHVASDTSQPPSLQARARIVLRAVYAQAESKAVANGLTFDYAAVRAAAAEAAGKRRIVEHASILVTLLDDPDVEVRQASVSALRRISTSFYGYRPDGSERERRDAVARWRELWPTG